MLAFFVDPYDWTMEKVNSITVNIEETEKPTYFTIGPNPVNDYLTVYFLNPTNNALEVKITDISGKTLISEHTWQEKLTLNTSSLNNGVYLVVVSDGKDSMVKKFIK